MAKITKDTLIADLLTLVPDSIPLLAELNMHCVGCAKAATETLGEACVSHNVDADAFVAKVNALAEEN